MKTGKIVNNFIYNTLYQILVLVVPLITIPYVSRVLGATNIGIFNYVQSIATYFILIGAVGTNLYGQREIAYLQDNPKERSRAFWEIEVFRIIVVMICTGIYAFVFLNYGKYTLIYGILIIEIAATAFDITWLFMGMEDFKITVIRNTIIKVVGVISIFVFVRSADDLGIYAACATMPVLLGNISLWFAIGRYVERINITAQQLFIGIKNRLLPIFVLFLPQIAVDVYTVLDKTMLGILASSIDEVGYYSQAQKVVKIILVIVTSLGTVMLPAMSAAFSRGDHEGIVNSIKIAFRVIYMLSFPLLFGICAISSRFVPIFFGPGYDPVVMLIIIISPILVIIATSNVLGKQFLLPTSQQKIFTISIIAGACVNVVLNFVLIHYWNAVGASIATVLAELTVTLFQIWFVRKQLPLVDCFKSGIRYCIFGAIMFFVVLGTGTVLPDERIWAMLVMIVIGVVVYVLELLISKDKMVQLAFELFKDKKSGR